MAKTMKNLSYTYNNDCCEVAQPSKSAKKEVHYPSMYLSHSIPDDLANANVGDILEIRAKVKVTRKEITESVEKTRAEVSIDFHEMAVEKTSKKAAENLADEVKRQLQK